MSITLQGQPNVSAEYKILECEKYEDYLETFVTSLDLRFLRDIRFCRKIVALGYRSTTVFTPEQFRTQKDILSKHVNPTKGQAILYGTNSNCKDAVLKEFAAREKPNYQKIISTIIFLTHRTKIGFEVSAFIDFEASLMHCNLQLPGYTNWEHIFQEKAKLRPKPDDLSYYDIHKGKVLHNDSDNYIVRHDVKHGLTFMHRGDHKKIFVDNMVSNVEPNYLRSVVHSPKYGYVVFFDHIVRKKI